MTGPRLTGADQTGGGLTSTAELAVNAAGPGTRMAAPIKTSRASIRPTRCRARFFRLFEGSIFFVLSRLVGATIEAGRRPRLMQAESVFGRLLRRGIPFFLSTKARSF